MMAAASVRPMARSELASSVTAADGSLSSRCRASHRSSTCSEGLGLLAKYAMCLYVQSYQQQPTVQPDHSVKTACKNRRVHGRRPTQKCRGTMDKI